MSVEALAAAALAAGFLGGVHCIGMCGGIAASLQAASKGPAVPRQIAFNAGRIGSYALAGATVGLVGIAFDAQVVLLVLANLLMLLLGLYVAGWGRGLMRIEAAGGLLWRRIEPLRRHFFPIDSTLKALGAGAVWGWVPCGLVYSMLGLALASGSPQGGALVLAAFGVGTLPSMLAAGFAAQKVLAFRRHDWVRRTAGLAIIALALLGLSRIPQVSQVLAAGWYCIV